MSVPQASKLAVDIVIDNFNYGRFLPAAIESACTQTHPRVNVIVVDDGSTDDSRRLLDGYRDRATVVLQENGGQASAINAGVELCRGEVTMILDADDVLHPNAAADVAAAFAADPELAKAQFRMEVIDEAGRPTGTLKPASHLPMPSGDVRQAELASPFDLVWMATSGNAFRTAALRRIMPIPEGPFHTCADWYLVHLMALLGPVVSLDAVDGYYRMHGANNYEPQTTELDLDHIRDTIRYSEATASELLGLADELSLPRPERILSIADLANRMISLRVEPEAHPIPDDSRLSLLGDAVRAARRRPNASTAMKAMFVCWFAAMAAAPRPASRHLARLFLFPQLRPSLNRLLGRLHLGRAGKPASQT